MAADRGNYSDFVVNDLTFKHKSLSLKQIARILKY